MGLLHTALEGSTIYIYEQWQITMYSMSSKGKVVLQAKTLLFYWRRALDVICLTKSECFIELQITKDPHYTDSICSQRFCCLQEFAPLKNTNIHVEQYDN